MTLQVLLQLWLDLILQPVQVLLRLLRLDPSAGSGLVEIINDPDKNGVFRISNTRQKFKIVSTDGTYTKTQVFNLSGLTLADEVSG